MSFGPGIYEGVGYDDYDAIQAMNSHGLADILDGSPFYFHQKKLEGRDLESRAMKLGTATHCKTLEPERFETEYAIEPDIAFITNPKTGQPYASPRASKPYKDSVSKLTDAGKIVLMRSDFEDAHRIAYAILAHPKVGKRLLEATGKETVLLWERDGLLCKARIDFYGDGWIDDLKTTSNFNGFSPFEVTKYHYYRQAAWYRSGALACGLNVECNFLTVVSTDVIEVAVFEIDPGDLQLGKEENDRGWETFRRCLDSGQWPGRYSPDEVHTACLTDWKRDQLSEASS